MTGKRRAVCWMATRNLYYRLLPGVTSLLTSNTVDAAYLIIEDDDFPYTLPDVVRAVNVSKQAYFPIHGPNYHTKWTYMVMMRAALTKVLPDEDEVLCLDVDTIVRGNIGKLFDTDLSGYYLAGVREPEWSRIYNRLYVNMGVALFNLKKLREDGMDDRLIRALNTERFEFVEQDCINRECAGHILELPGEYNATRFTTKSGNPLIKHFAAIPNWHEEPEVMKWERYYLDNWDRNI